MRTIEVKVFHFDELSDDAKQKALDKLRYNDCQYDWWDSIYEDAKEIGIKLDSFELDRNRHCTGEFLLSAVEVAQNILNAHGDKCETFKTATEFIKDWEPVFHNYMDETHEDYESRKCEDEMMSLEDDFRKSILEDYSIMLQHEADYLSSDEAIKESITANEHEFTEDGELI